MVEYINMNKFILVILTAIFFLAPFLCSAEQYNMEKIFYMSQLKEKQGIADLKKYSDKIDILAPQFYAVSAKLILTCKCCNNVSSLPHIPRESAN